MNRLLALARFLWDFAIGDDWRAAVGIAGAIAVTAVLAHEHIGAWWLLPPAVIAILALSLLRVARAR